MEQKTDISMIDNALSHKNITDIEEVGGEYFKRIRKFKVKNKKYKIEWYHNQSYLYIEDVIIPFFRVKQQNTWPIGKKMNLQFYDERNEVCCVLPIEEYKELEK